MDKALNFLLHPPEWMKPPDWMILILWACFAYAVVKLLLRVVPILPLFVRAKLAGIKIGWFELIGLQLRNGIGGARSVVNALIAAEHNRLKLDPIAVEAHHLASGDAGLVVTILGLAKHGNVPLTWDEAATLDLMGAGKELYDAVIAAGRDSQNTGPLETVRARLHAESNPQR